MIQRGKTVCEIYCICRCVIIRRTLLYKGSVIQQFFHRTLCGHFVSTGIVLSTII